MAEDDGCLVASSALDVHKVGVRSRHQSFKFVFLLFGLESRVQQVSVHVVEPKIRKYFIKLSQVIT